MVLFCFGWKFQLYMWMLYSRGSYSLLRSQTSWSPPWAPLPQMYITLKLTMYFQMAHGLSEAYPETKSDNPSCKESIIPEKKEASILAGVFSLIILKYYLYLEFWSQKNLTSLCAHVLKEKSHKNSSSLLYILILKLQHWHLETPKNNRDVTKHSIHILVNV